MKAPQLGNDAPWKQRYRVEDSFAEIAREDPGRGLVVSNRSGVNQLYAWDVASGELRQLTDRPTGIRGGTIAPNGRSVYYLDDRDGNEIGHYVRVPFEGGEPEDLTPDLPPYSTFGGAESLAGNIIGLMAADAEGFHIYAIDPEAVSEPGAAREIFRSAALSIGPSLSRGGELAAISSTERSGKFLFSVVVVDTSSGEKLGELWDGPETSVQPRQFSPAPGDDRLLAVSDRSGIKRPLIWNPRTDERTDLVLDGIAGDVEVFDWSRDGRTVLLCQTHRAAQQLYLYDLDAHLARKLDHPGGTYYWAYFAPQAEIWAQWTSSTQPNRLIALDVSTGARKREVLAPGDVPPCRPWRSVSFTSSDGQEIQGWLAVPEGAGPFPTILETHGGPTAAVHDEYSAGSQAWLDHGLAFLTINYRGSTTFGRDFQHQIDGNLGNLEVEDMVAAREWILREGIARPDQILLTGWSYGGYLTLQALGKRPELWAGGMAGIAIADWVLMYEDQAATLRGYQAALFGGTPEQKPEQHAISSPITYAEAVSAPVLIIQGRNDTRTPARQVQKYEERLRELGKEIQVHWFEAGHGSQVVEQQIEHQEIMLNFAYHVLSGRPSGS